MKRIFLRKTAGYVSLLLLLALVIAKSYRAGTDINVYLFASQQLGMHENIYAYNPYNDYLYSPLFALLLWPLSVLDFKIARVLWALLNAILAYRLWSISMRIINASFQLSNQMKTWLTIGIIVLAVGALLHNLNLGQISIVILWLTFEGLYLIIVRNRKVTGAALLAIGITIKIIPVIGLYYLFFKKQYRTLAYAIGFILLCLLLPGLFIGHKYNVELLSHWKDKINPASAKYVFDESNGCNSLSAIIPAYVYNFYIPDDNDRHGFRRKIADLPAKTVLYIVQALRILLVLSILPLVFYSARHNKAEDPFYFFWEFAYLMLVSILLFPHQMKYVLLYFVPAGAYVLLYLLGVFSKKDKQPARVKWIIYSSIFLLLLFALSGRDIMGEHIVDVIDFYHVQGLTVIVFLFYLYKLRPPVFKGLFVSNDKVFLSESTKI